jgi:AsmA protein
MVRPNVQRFIFYPVMNLLKILKWTTSVLLALTVLAVSGVALLGWNWLRAPIEQRVLDKTGRALRIQGDLQVTWGWPWPKIQAHTVTFANPPWAKQPQMLTAEVVAFSVSVPQLLLQNWVIPDLQLTRPIVFLELGSEGRKTWLLDRNQQDDSARIQIDRLTLDQGSIGYDDLAGKTSVRAELSTLPAQPGSTSAPGVSFNARGQIKGLPFTAQGTGDSVLALRDDTTPYALKLDTTVGHTRIRADGRVTSLLKFSAVDLQLAVSGQNLDQLFVLTGIAWPATRDYVTQGHLLRTDNTWRYEQFSGRVGTSDLAGWLQVKTGGKRPALTGNVVSTQLTFADLGPVIGSRPGSLQTARQASAQPVPVGVATPRLQRVIPDLPFKFERWDSVDVELDFNAKSIRPTADLPLESLNTHLSLRDAVLTLDPLQLGLAGGQLNGQISLDGRHDPIQAKVQVRARQIKLAQLLPVIQPGPANTSQIGGELKLAGSGNSVGRMLAGANGSLGLLVSAGEISQLTMEKAGLHLWEILRLTLTGDTQIKLRCAMANFDVKAGNMQTNALVFDTAVTTLTGTGNIDLGQEKLNLTLTQKTKNTSPLALRSPIHVGGTFAKPEVKVDPGRMAVRALGALALGAINPLLVLIPLIDAGPGKDSDCSQWLHDKK